MKHIISGILAVVLCLSVMALSGCGTSSGTPAMEYEGVSISEDIYRYWLCSFKDFYVTHYSDITDDLSTWNRDTGNGSTVGELVENYTHIYAQNMLCAMKLFDQYGLKLSDKAYDSIDDSINEIIRYQYDSSKSKFNKALMDTYGINTDTLRQAFIIEEKASMVEQYLYGSDGKDLPTDSEVNSFFQDKYLHIEVIVMKTAFDYLYDDKGEIKTDAQGKYLTVKYTEEQKAAKKKTAEEVYQNAVNGGDFTELINQYDEYFRGNQVDGYYLSAYDMETLIGNGYSSSLLTEVYKMEMGKVLMLEDEEAAYIVKRIPLTDQAYKKAGEGSLLADITDHIITYRYDQILSEMIKDIVETDYVKNLKIVDVNRGIL